MVADWLREYWFEIFLAFVFALVAGYAYEKIKPKSKIEQPTVIRKKESSVLARLILPNNTEIKILENKMMLGRQNFIGTVSADDLQFIGREHFKIMKMDDGFYIEDLGSANGTKLNGEEIKGAGRKQLNDRDEIVVADVLKMKYVQR